MSPDSCVLAVDLGKTWCRAALLPVPDRDSRPDRTTGPAPSAADVATVPGAVGLAEDGGARAAVRAVDAALRSWEQRARGAAGRLVAVGVGAAGATAAPAAARELAAELAARTGAPAAVTSDAVTSHAGALGGSPGVVLAAGTGAVAVAVGPVEGPGAGRVEQVDGWGQWLGDEGSGAWMGQQGLRAVVRAQDLRGPATVLCERALDDFGPLDELPATLAAGNLVRATAAFAPRVLEAARAGDGVALDVVRAAAARLGETTVAAVRRCRLNGTTPVALVGGLSQAGPPLVDLWWDTVTAAGVSAQRVPALGDSLSGAGLLALRTDLPHESAVVRSPRSAPAHHLEDL